MKKLFIFEKPSMLSQFFKSLANPEDVGVVFFAIASFKFEYSYHNLLELPVFPEKAKYRYTGGEKNCGKVYDSKTKIKEKESEWLFNALKEPENNADRIKKYFESFDEIIYAMDFDETGVRAFVLFFNRLFGTKSFEEIEKKFSVSVLNTYFYNHQKMFDNRENQEYKRKLKYFEKKIMKKDNKEYVFNINSFNIFHTLYNDFKILDKNEQIFTRKYIQILQEYQNLNKLLDKGSLVCFLSKKEIGSVLSRHKIIDNLIDIGFLKEDDNKCLSLTYSGLYFLNKIPNYNLDNSKEIFLFFNKISKTLLN